MNLKIYCVYERVFFAGNILLSEQCLQSWPLCVNSLPLLDCYHTVGSQVSGSHCKFCFAAFYYAKSCRMPGGKQYLWIIYWCAERWLYAYQGTEECDIGPHVRSVAHTEFEC